MKIKTFKGKLEDSAQDKINLHGGDIGDGFRIAKLAIIPRRPGAVRQESVVKVYKLKQSSVDAVIDFSDDALLAAGITTSQTDANDAYSQIIVFDREVINQDIYITHEDQGTSSAACNYYLELEEIKMSGPQQAVVNFKAALNHGR